MSMTYPETTGRALEGARATNAVSGDSALFPGGAANLYDRARKTRSSLGGARVAWVVAPIAVVLVGGAAVYALMPHDAPPARATTTRPATAQTLTSHTTASTAPTPVLTPAPRRVARSTEASGSAPVKRSAHVPTSAEASAPSLPAGPQSYNSTAGAQTAPTVPAPPAAAPTPGDFTLTPPASLQSSAPAQPSATPAPSSTDAAPAPATPQA